MAKKVLVVDDDVSTVKFLATALEVNGYIPLKAYNGREGLEMIQKDKPDLVLLDVMMPKKTGFTLYKQLRKDEKYKDLPVIMLTGIADVLEDLDSKSEDSEVRPYDGLWDTLRATIKQMRDEELLNPGMFIDKPIDQKLVIARVKEFIGT